MTKLAQEVGDSVSLGSLMAEIDQVFDDFQDFERSCVGCSENWQDFRPLLLSILADISLKIGKSHRYIKELRIDSGAHDALVITDRNEHEVLLPRMQ